MVNSMNQKKPVKEEFSSLTGLIATL